MNDQLQQAKCKALTLLNYMDRTESQLRNKLKEKGFDAEVIDEAIAYVKSFGYINDIGYAERYVLNKQKSKSRQEIKAALLQKGIRREHIELAFDSCYEKEDEIDAIRRLCEKKHFCLEDSTDAEKKKMYDYLMRKGFRREDVHRALHVSE